MKPFASSKFFNDDFFNDLVTYKLVSDATEWSIRVVITPTVEQIMGGGIKKFIADFADISIFKMDIGFAPAIHDKIIAGSLIYEVITIRDDGDCYMLNCKKSTRVQTK